MSEEDSVQGAIQRQVDSNPVILYMKGTPDQPRCGFSQRAAQALAGCGREFAYVDVLEDEQVREGIKAFGSWSTLPQLYIDGQLVGGCDEILAAYESGALQERLDEAAG